MDLVEALYSFCAVAGERSFTRGAERRGQPQPVASRRIAALEKRLGAPVFIRTSRTVSLSPEGERLLPMAQELLACVERIDGTFAAAETAVVIAVPPLLAAQARAAIRRGLHPRTVIFAEDDPHTRAEQLTAGAVQLAVVPTAMDVAEIQVPLGVAHHDHRPVTRFHLDQLRRPVRERDQPPRAIHLLAEDDVPAIRDPLRDVCDAVGLRHDQVAVGTAEHEAWTRVHERGDVVLAVASHAERQGVDWSPLAHPTLHRSYRLGDAGSGLNSNERSELMLRLAIGLGGHVVEDHIERSRQ